MAEKIASVEPLVSILVPAYNHERYVQATIRSAIGQTYGSIELLVINDGSTDSTWSKIVAMEDTCAARFCRHIFWNQANMGTCMTLNSLLDNARGKYICFVASDDALLPCAIEKQLCFLEQNPEYALCVGDNGLMDESGRTCYWSKKRIAVYNPEKAAYKTFGEFLQQVHGFSFLSERFGSYRDLYRLNHVPNGYLVRSTVFENFRYTQEAPLEDWSLMLHIAKYYRMKYLDEVLLMYRWHSANSVKDTAALARMEDATRNYERSLLRTIDSHKVMPDVADFIKNELDITPNPPGIKERLFRKLKLVIYAFIFFIAQLPLIGCAFPQIVVRRIQSKILYFGNRGA